MRVPKVSVVVLISLLSFASALAAPRGIPAAQTTCAPSCKIYLAFISLSNAPQLVAPIDGFVSPSLAPDLIWSPLTAAKYQIQVATDPQFPDSTIALSSTKTIKQPLPALVNTSITSNLKGSMLFYWRVGVPSDQGYAYSSVRTFTTPAKSSGTLPIATSIFAPRNNAVIKGGGVVLMEWKTIPGAVSYRIRMYDQAGHSVSEGTEELGGTANNLLVEGLPNGTYHWKVKTQNAFGWGDYSTEFYFTLN
jgi:hypothetical protein